MNIGSARVAVKFLFAMLLVLFFLVSCSFQQTIKEIAVRGEEVKIATETKPFSNDACSFSSAKENNYGYSVIHVDAITNEELPMRTKDVECGVYSVDKESFTVFVFREGYAPMPVKITPDLGSIITYYVPLYKSCAGGPQCVDTIPSYSGKVVIPDGDANVLDAKFKEDGKSKFGVEQELNYECFECDLFRAGQYKAQGKTQSGKHFAYAYKEGWCAYGVSDCGNDFCFMTDDHTLFQEVLDYLCPRLKWDEYKMSEQLKWQFDKYAKPDVEVFDKSEEIRQACLSGEYTQEFNGMQVLAINQESGRFSSAVTMADPDCLAR